MAGPVHVNFPFDEPLKPDFPAADRWAAAKGGDAGDRRGVATGAGIDDGGAFADAGSPVPADAFSFCRSPLPSTMLAAGEALASADAARIREVLAGRRTLVLAGEGACSTLAEARDMIAWAKRCGFPLLADPLSGLRCVDDPCVIDAYDAVFGQDGCPLPDAVIRFGRYPVSKRATMRLAAARPFNIVVDAGETRDYNAATDWFVASTPLGFARSLDAPSDGEAPSALQSAFLEEWTAANERTRARLAGAAGAADGLSAGELFEGDLVRAVLEDAPSGSCLFIANSMAVRNLDTFQRRGSKPLCVMANRGQNGIDGTLSTAIGAAQRFEQTTFITGDLTLQHDINALALQHELLVNQPGTPPAIVVVLLNNDGGAIFDMLPQASDDPYFERLFLTPQNVDFEHAALAFGVPYRRAASLEEFSRFYRERLRFPGISLIEARVPLRDLKERLGGCWK